MHCQFLSPTSRTLQVSGTRLTQSGAKTIFPRRGLHRNGDGDGDGAEDQSLDQHHASVTMPTFRMIVGSRVPDPGRLKLGTVSSWCCNEHRRRQFPSVDERVISPSTCMQRPLVCNAVLNGCKPRTLSASMGNCREKIGQPAAKDSLSEVRSAS